jgi:hypothetical protein
MAEVQLLVFDSRRGNREGEEIKKVLAFYPANTPTVEQITTAGLLHGLLLFSSNFSQVRLSSLLNLYFIGSLAFFSYESRWLGPGPVSASERWHLPLGLCRTSGRLLRQTRAPGLCTRRSPASGLHWCAPAARAALSSRAALKSVHGVQGPSRIALVFGASTSAEYLLARPEHWSHWHVWQATLLVWIMTAGGP